MTGGFSLLEPGVSRYHHIGLIVPISAAIFPFLIAPYFRRFEQHHHIITALLLGAATALFAYTLMKFVPGLIESQYTLNKAVLLGLLASEILVFTYPRGGGTNASSAHPSSCFSCLCTSLESRRLSAFDRPVSRISLPTIFSAYENASCT